MTPINKLNHNQKLSLLGKTIHMKASCEFFPNFDITGKLISWHIANNGEFVYTCKISSNKTIQIGTNMKDLVYEIL